MDSVLALTRGRPLGFWVVLRHLRLEENAFTAVLQPGEGHPNLIGQASLRNDNTFGQVTFVLPAASQMTLVARLMDELARQVGQQGGLGLLAAVEDESPLFEGLRQSGFAVYARQRVWRLGNLPLNDAPAGEWLPLTALDEFAIRSLYQALTPPLVQRAEPFGAHGLAGMVYQQGGELLGFMEAHFGPRGILLYPLFHPEVRQPAAALRSYLRGLHFSLGRPVYVAVRSYQAWLEDALRDLGGEAVVQHALLVRHLTLAQRAPVLAPATASRDNRQPALMGPLPEETRPLPARVVLPEGAITHESYYN
ncbi:MAG: hypothetical protein ACPLUL_12345 [Thermanaerothrix sp.]|uniref:N-acetyltransferase domain-containing protein n=1 Tax=Thermanaerothrix solaris TaxID=3058434 RepID=A0ABU3NNU2_9CHLR|nr:hypothetical protein [Thermanaerothrix sp. 4228-RoL]MDT8898516.1 hypothetical protein [Thermanaerothrix sp. 4228-RoL]